MTYNSNSSRIPECVEISCDAVKQAGSTTSGYYTIDPDGAGGVSSFTLYCDMTASPVRTILHHDRETRQLVHWAAGQSGASCISRPVTYSNGVTYAQARTIVTQHSSCSYYYKHQCFENSLTDSSWVDYNNVGHTDWSTTTQGICQSSMYSITIMYERKCVFIQSCCHKNILYLHTDVTFLYYYQVVITFVLL